jgi:hypothetical protein
LSGVKCGARRLMAERCSSPWATSAKMTG